MPEWAIALVLNEGPLRLGAFGGVLALLLVLQWLRPLRGDGRGQRRQATNLLLIALDTIEICEAIADGAVLPTWPDPIDPARHRIRLLTSREIGSLIATVIFVLLALQR